MTPGFGAASRVTLVLVGVLSEEDQQGELETDDTVALSRATATEARRIGHLAFPDVPLPTIGLGLLARSHLFGQVSFGLFDRCEGGVEHPDVHFGHAIASIARNLGIGRYGSGRA
jgi:hypothetical protein